MPPAGSERRPRLRFGVDCEPVGTLTAGSRTFPGVSPTAETSHFVAFGVDDLWGESYLLGFPALRTAVLVAYWPFSPPLRVVRESVWARVSC
jgi:hypothetical protein